MDHCKISLWLEIGPSLDWSYIKKYYFFVLIYLSVLYLLNLAGGSEHIRLKFYHNLYKIEAIFMSSSDFK